MELDLVTAFLDYLQVQGKRSATVAQYRINLGLYVQYLSSCSILSFFAATIKILSGYQKIVLAQSLTPGTVWRKLHAVYALYAWLQAQGYLLCNPCVKPRLSAGTPLPRRIPDQGTLSKIYALLLESNKLYEQRDYVLIDLAYSCGLRRGELQRLNVEDIDSAQGTIWVQGKGGRERLVPIGKHTLQDLERYIYHVRPQLMKQNTTTALFVSWIQGGKRLHKESINAIFRRLRKKYRLDSSLTTHGLRHAFATDMLRSGAPVQEVSLLLGHAKLETTQIYTRLVPADLKRQHERYHPRG